ncbi:type I-C CRISPR-associated endonuclease Cas1c [Oleiagrimonas sp. C23AA]|uniref:type I-C CRISPR-associated endonuclease Cas1c n=1 Tax=Oleiagrimonas sp. C23AA TaxID=2719047 RepID=UPI0014237732|nr:type I-C CRISPR-associated endonuclease Cas1 [Oleiagrimonas sp. C23AA]
MRRQLNTLYATTDGAWLHKDGANIVMRVDREERGRIPAHMLESLVCIGRMSISPQLMAFCAEQGISISYLTEHGRFLARVEGPVSGNVLLRRRQYRCSDQPGHCATLVRHMLVGKLHGQRAVLARGLRDYAGKLDDQPALEQAVERLTRIPKRMMRETDTDSLRGLEGDAARIYFGAFDQLIRVGSARMRFHGRSRRPPKDACNAVLSFLYTLITHDCRSALETVGLDPAVGFLHRDRPGRPSLALDMAENFRPLLGDRLALTLINRKQLAERDFRYLDNGAVLLKDDARKKVLVAYQERKREQLLHSFLDEKVDIGLVPYTQAQLLARHLRGDLDAYPPFLWK